MDLKELTTKIEALEGKAQELLSKAEADDATLADVKSFQTTLNDEVLPEIARLKDARERAERDEEVKALRTHVTTLDEVINELKKPAADFVIGGKSVESTVEEDPYTKGERSFFQDIKLANKGRQEAIEAIGVGPEGKAMSEGVAAQGGYLVRPTVERQIVQTLEQDNVMRALCSSLNVSTTEISLDQITLGTTAGWVAELAQKPEGTSMTLASVSASVFTAAGLATISNQLLADSDPAVDGLVTTDLAKRLVALEESAFLAGTGTGQPLGLLNTPGVQTQGVTATDPDDASGIIFAILDAITKVQEQHGQPTAILMHPRTWTRIIRDQNSAGFWTIGTPSGAVTRDVTQPRSIYTGPEHSLWGVRVVLSNRIPTNLGTGTNESRVIVGDFSEALILDRQGITVDESPHVYFTSNQTVFRAEKRVGFTAARQPKAFCIVGGAGLATG